MEIEIQDERENKLMNRREVRFRVRHGQEGTPTRQAIREELTKLLKAQDKALVVDHVRTEFGKTGATGYAKVYDSLEEAQRVERPHILRRNELEAEG